MKNIIDAQEIISTLFFYEGSEFFIKPSLDNTYVPKLAHRVPLINITFDEQREIYPVFACFWDGITLSDKFKIEMLELFNCLKTMEYTMYFELTEDELKQLCSLFDPNIWKVECDID